MADDLLKFYSVTGDCALFQLSAGHVPTIKVKIGPRLEIEGILCAGYRSGEIFEVMVSCSLHCSCDTLVCEILTCISIEEVRNENWTSEISCLNAYYGSSNELKKDNMRATSLLKKLYLLEGGSRVKLHGIVSTPNFLERTSSHAKNIPLSSPKKYHRAIHVTTLVKRDYTPPPISKFIEFARGLTRRKNL